jgi:D-alanyl-D-alanine-carboxypeptidase/D-alanyl-D-alanine-endopeptidase
MYRFRKFARRNELSLLTVAAFAAALVLGSLISSWQAIRATRAERAATKVVAYGQRERGKNEPVDGDTLFEIGSVTKVFTTLLLQDMADRKEVKLDDPIGKYLLRNVKTPRRDGREITLLDLATHTSGLPDAPDNFHRTDGDDPWADYTVAQMYDFLSHYALPRAIGTTYEYSNVGMGLLGPYSGAQSRNQLRGTAREARLQSAANEEHSADA